MCIYVRTCIHYGSPLINCCNPSSIHQLVCIHLSYPRPVLLLRLGTGTERLGARSFINTFADNIGHSGCLNRGQHANGPYSPASFDIDGTGRVCVEESSGTLIGCWFCQLRVVHRLGG